MLLELLETKTISRQKRFPQMKTIRKKRILFLTIAIVLLAMPLLLRKFSSEKGSLNPNENLSSHLEADDAVDTIDSTYNQIDTATSSTLKPSPPIDIGVPNLDDVVATEEIVRSTIISNFCRNIGLKIEPLPNPLDAFIFRRQPKLDEKLIYRQVVITCDKNGEPVNSEAGVGFQNQLMGHVIEVDPNQETYTVEWRSEPYFGVIGANAEVIQLEDPRGKMWKEKTSFRGKTLNSSESEVTSLKGADLGDYPEFEYPNKALMKGESWTIASANNKENLLKASLKDFAIVNDKTCAVIHISMRVQTKVDSSKAMPVQLDIESEGFKYVDYETGLLVAEDMVTTSSANGPTMRARCVKQLVSCGSYE